MSVSSSTYVSPVVPTSLPPGARPLSAKEDEVLKSLFTTEFSKFVSVEKLNGTLHKMREAERFKESGERKMKEGSKKIEEGSKKTEEGQKKIEEGSKKIEEGQKKIEESQRLRTEGQKKIEEADKRMAAVIKGRQDILTKQFWAIFNGKTLLATEKCQDVFGTYLADGSFSVEKNSAGSSYLKINSMKPVIKYLSENPETPTCNFTAFKKEVNDVGTLAEFLKTAKVAEVILNGSISKDDKDLFAAAQTARASTAPLKIVYLA